MAKNNGQRMGAESGGAIPAMIGKSFYHREKSLMQ